MNTVSNIIARETTAKPSILPPLAHTPTLLALVDFGGLHKTSTAFTMSILLVDYADLWYWMMLQREIREATLRRRMSFKNLNERYRSRVLVPFLRAANSVSGLLCTWIVDKGVESLFTPLRDATQSHHSVLAAELNRWDRDTRERLLLFSHALALLLAGLSAKNQNLLIVSDEDSMVANATRMRVACDVVGRVSSHYLPHQLGHARLATTKSDPGNLTIEDLAAIPDFAAGAWAECVGRRKPPSRIPVGFLGPLDRSHSAKTRAVLTWLAESWHPLKRWTLVLQPHANSVRARWMYLEPKEPISEFDWEADFRTRFGEYVPGVPMIVPGFGIVIPETRAG